VTISIVMSTITESARNQGCRRRCQASHSRISVKPAYTVKVTGTGSNGTLGGKALGESV
jgi:hypothetical protein